jgi:hypothetical protein
MVEIDFHHEISAAGQDHRTRMSVEKFDGLLDSTWTMHGHDSNLW